MPDMLIQTIRVLWFLIFYMNKEKKNLFEICCILPILGTPPLHRSICLAIPSSLHTKFALSAKNLPKFEMCVDMSMTAMHIKTLT